MKTIAYRSSRSRKPTFQGLKTPEQKFALAGRTVTWAQRKLERSDLKPERRKNLEAMVKQAAKVQTALRRVMSLKALEAGSMAATKSGSSGAPTPPATSQPRSPEMTMEEVMDSQLRTTPGLAAQRGCH